MKILLRIAAVVAGAALLIISIIAFNGHRQYTKARELMNDLRGLVAGPIETQRIQSFIAKHDLHRTDSDTERSYGHDSYEVVLENNVLARFHLAAWTRLGVLLVLRDQTLRYVQAWYYVSCRGDMTSGVTVEQQFLAQPETPAYQLSVFPAGGKPPNIRIEMTQLASPMQRSAALKFEVGCLARIGGCSGASQLLPSAEKPGLGCSPVPPEISSKE